MEEVPFVHFRRLVRAGTACGAELDGPGQHMTTSPHWTLVTCLRCLEHEWARFKEARS